MFGQACLSKGWPQQQWHARGACGALCDSRGSRRRYGFGFARLPCRVFFWPTPAHGTDLTTADVEPAYTEIADTFATHRAGTAQYVWRLPSCCEAIQPWHSATPLNRWPSDGWIGPTPLGVSSMKTLPKTITKKLMPTWRPGPESAAAITTLTHRYVATPPTPNSCSTSMLTSVRGCRARTQGRQQRRRRRRQASHTPTRRRRPTVPLRGPLYRRCPPLAWSPLTRR